MLSPDNYVQGGLSQNFNRYSYCINNPLKYTDPSGNIFLWDDLIVGGVGFVMGYLSYGLSHHGDWGEKALLAGGIGAGTALLGYYSGGGFALAAHGTLSGGASFAGSYALSAAVGQFMPSINIPLANNFSISVSPC
jgi:hypothetical protein